MAQCGDNDGLLKNIMADSYVPAGLSTCPMISGSPGGCDSLTIALVCAESCKYSGPCKGDEAVAVLFARDPSDPIDPDDPNIRTCAEVDQALIMSQADALLKDYLMSVKKDICGMRRARKMSAAPQADAPKARKLAAAMLRTIKTTARRLTQAAVSPHPTATPLPMLRAALPSPFLR